VEDEAEMEQILGDLQDHLPHPALSELIFSPEQISGFPHSNPTAEQVVDFAAAYQPQVLSDDELTALLDRLIRSPATVLEEEESYRLEDSLPGYDCYFPIRWARLKGWSGAELLKRIRSGKLERDEVYQDWAADVRETE
jgi:hypothetical protein